MKREYKPTIGIEVHVGLKTDSKMFCSCKASHFRVKPNTHTCPVCLGLPGALPIPNQKAIEWCLKIGLALECQVNKTSKFDRKNYFYPDLAKGYQISQYDQPFCQNGKIKVGEKTIIINRVHMEEDTGKLLHKTIDGEKVSLVDFNRSGVPLVEIVTEPNISSADEAVEYLKKIQQIMRYLGVSNCDMEKGSMRCEVNISLSKDKKLAKYKVEVKNINSFKFVKKAIDYEIKRQKKLLEKGQTPLQETRGFDEKKQKTYAQRGKEEAHDYRYFPEPDIPLIKLSEKYIEKLTKSLPELPEEKKQRFMKTYNLSEYNTQLLTTTQEIAQYFEQAAKISGSPEGTANIIINKRVNINKYSPQQLVNHLKKQKLSKVDDKQELTKLVNQVLKDNQKGVEDYKKGKKEVIGFLIGQIMKNTKGKADASIVRKILLEKLTITH